MFFDQFFCSQNKSYSLTIEDDERVCYAYLMKSEQIVGDVWLYNTVKAPDKAHWSSKDEMPFLNPLEYVGREIFPIQSSDEVKVKWTMSGDGLKEVIVFLRDEIIARIEPGAKPGWSIAVKKDGPLAKKLISNRI